MKKRIVASVIVATLICLLCCAFTSASAGEKDRDITSPIENAETIAEVDLLTTTTNLTPIEIPEWFSVEKIEVFIDENLENYSIEELDNLISTHKQRQTDAHELAEEARALGWPEDSNAITLAKTEWWNSYKIIEVYQTQKDILYVNSEQALWDARMAEYPEATTVWLYMKDLGWNDYVCAGILGNMMAECGGQTLALQYSIYSPGGWFYGLCQWSKQYFPDVQGQSLEFQCDYLRDTIQEQFDAFGFCYAKGFNLEAFLELTNEKDAALAFAECYERCGSGSYYIRQKNATVAYNYFVD